MSIESPSVRRTPRKYAALLAEQPGVGVAPVWYAAGLDERAKKNPAFCGAFASGETRIRTGDTTIFS